MAVPVLNGKTQFFDAAGVSLGLGTVSLYVPGTLTAKQTWQDQAKTSLNTTPTIALDAGGYAMIYGTGAYRQIVKDSLGNTIWDQIAWANDVDAAIATLTAELAAPSGSGLVGHTAGILGAVDTTVQAKLREFKSVKADFGAKGDNSTNDTSAFNLAIAYANSAGGYVTIWIPDGKYVLSGALTPITASHVCFIGSSNGGAVLNLSYGGPSFTWTGYGGGAENLQITYSSAPPANAVVFYQNGGDSQNFRNLRVFNIRTLHQAGKSDGSTVGNNTTYSGLKGNVYNSGSPTFKLYAAAGFYLDNCSLYVAGVGVPTTNRVSTMTTVSGTHLLETGQKTVDTVVIGDNCIFERYYRVMSLVLGTSSDVILNVTVSATTICDYIREDVYHLDGTSGGGGIVNTTIAGYAGSWEGRSVNVLGSASIRDLDIDKLYSPYAGYEAIKLNNASASHIRILQPRLISSDRLNTGVSGINYAVGEHVNIIQAESGYSGAYAGLNWQAAYGITVAADMGAYTIADCDCDGATAAFNIAVNASGSTNRRIRDNTNANYAGRKTGSGAPYTAPATTVAWTNVTPFVVSFAASGAGVTSMQHNGTTVMTNSGVVSVQPGETAGYNGVATVEFFVEP